MQEILSRRKLFIYLLHFTTNPYLFIVSIDCPCLDVVIVGGANLLRLRVPHNQQETGPGGQQLLPLRPSGDEPL